MGGCIEAAAWAVAGGIPGTIAGALLSHLAGGPVLLIASGIVLVIVGLRVVQPIGEAARERAPSGASTGHCSRPPCS